MRRPAIVLVLTALVASLAAAQDGTTVDLGPEVSTESAPPGGAATHSLTVRNPTPTMQNYTLSFSGSGGWNVTVQPKSLDVAGSATGTVQLTVRVPANATVGSTRSMTVTARNTALESDSDSIVANTTVGSPPPSTSVPPAGSSPAASEETKPSDASPFVDATTQAAPGEFAAPAGPGPGAGLLRWPEVDARAVAWAATTWTASFGLGLLLLHESARFRLRLLLALLFSRLERDRVLDHGLRERIFESIRRAPGLHYGGLRKALGVPAGTLAHHLFVLERQELVRSARDGFRKRYYPRGRADWGPPPLDALQQSIVDLVRSQPGIHQRAIAATLQLSKQVVNYHVTQLSATGRLLLEREGRVTHCYPARTGP